MRYCLPTAKVEDYNIMVDSKNFLINQLKMISKYMITFEKLQLVKEVITLWSHIVTTFCLLDYNYFKKHYKIIATDLRKQQPLDADPNAIQQINFIGNLRGANNRVIFFHYWRSERNHFRFFTRICESFVILFCFKKVSI